MSVISSLSLEHALQPFRSLLFCCFPARPSLLLVTTRSLSPSSLSHLCPAQTVLLASSHRYKHCQGALTKLLLNLAPNRYDHSLTTLPCVSSLVQQQQCERVSRCSTTLSFASDGESSSSTPSPPAIRPQQVPKLDIKADFAASRSLSRIQLDLSQLSLHSLDTAMSWNTGAGGRFSAL